jgi:multiple sugar transport system substrate-binding protein
MKPKKVLALLVSLVMLATVFAGCKSTSSSSSPVSSGTTNAPAQSIVFYGGWTGADQATMQALVTKFNSSQSSIKVQFTSLQWTQIFAKFLTDYAAGNSPNVLALHSFEMGQFASMGVLDSSAIKDLNLKKADFIDAAWTGSIYNSIQYSVPLDVNMHALFYNKDLFAKAGITAPPTTGVELIADAQKLTVDKSGKLASDTGFDANNVQTYGLGFNMNHHAFYQAFGLLNQQGNNPFTDSMTSVNIDVAKTAKAFGYLEDLIFKYKVTPKGEKSPIDDFKAGTVGMIIDGNWQLSAMASSNMNWATAEYPNIFGTKAVWGASEALTIPLSKSGDTSKNKAAETFIKWISDNSIDWAQSGQLPANKVALEKAKTLVGRQAFANELSYTFFLPANPKSTQLFSSAAPSPILTAAQNAVLNNKDATEIAKQLKLDMDAVLK